MSPSIVPWWNFTKLETQPPQKNEKKKHMNWCVQYALLFYRSVSHLMIHVLSQSLCPIMFNYYQWYIKYYQIIISVYLSQLSLFSHKKSYELCKIFNISLYSHSDILTIQWYIDYHWYSDGLIVNISLYVTDILTYIANNHRHFPPILIGLLKQATMFVAVTLPGGKLLLSQDGRTGASVF